MDAGAPVTASHMRQDLHRPLELVHTAVLQVQAEVRMSPRVCPSLSCSHYALHPTAAPQTCIRHELFPPEPEVRPEPVTFTTIVC